MWSSLLGQRELLQNEIRRGTQLLEQWHKEQLESASALINGPGTIRMHQGFAQVRCPGLPVEKFLAGWVNQLKQTLTAISGELDSAPDPQAAVRGEESMFELLRGAG